MPPSNPSNAAAENNPSESGNTNSVTTNPGQVRKDTGIANDNSGPSADISNGTNSGTSDAKVTLAQFLGGMFCNGCDKNCCLLNPGCEKGASKQAAARQQYQTLYGTTVVQ